MRALVLALLLPLAGLAADNFLPVSVWYAGGKVRAPMLEPVTAASPAIWRQDLARIKSLGFNTVRTWVEWTAGEPRRHEYHLEQLDLMLRLAQEAGLKVIVQMYADSAPDWLADAFPDGHLVAQSGQAIPSQAAPGFCFDHPGVRQATLDFLSEVARHAAKSPAFYGWDLWSEPHIINWAEISYIPNASFCYCPHTMARFRRWLQTKYGGLPALNNAWYRRFQEWQQVEPPRFDTILSYTDYVDWRVFITEKLADDLRARTRTVKQFLPDRVATSHAAGPSALGSLAGGDGNPDDYLMYRAVDYYGTSLYAWYPMNAGYESEGYGLIELDGNITDRAQLAGEAARQIAASSDLLLRAHLQPAEVAIVVNQLTNLIGGAGHLYNRGAVARSLSGYYRIFSERNIAVDFVNAIDLTAAQAKPYKLIVVPYPLLMLKSEAAALEEYVRGGGHLFTEARAGWVDDRGHAQEVVPGFGWDKMLGVREKSITPKPDTTIRWDDDPMAGAILEERFTKLDAGAKPLAMFEDGAPAAFEHPYGAGRAIVVGTFPGQANETPEAASRSNIVVGNLPGAVRRQHPLGAFLAGWASLSVPDLKTTTPIDVQQLIADTGRLIFLMNWDARPARVDLAIPVARQVREITTGAVVAPAARIQTEVPAQSVRVYRLDY